MGFLSNKKIFRKIFISFSKKINKQNNNSTIIFIVLLIIVMFCIVYNVSTLFKLDLKYFINISVLVLFFILLLIFINDKNNFTNLNIKYDDLLDCFSFLEENLEIEELNRHEYKNQVAVLRSSTKDKKVVKMIDSMFDNTNKTSSSSRKELKKLPNGGLRGLIDYKIAIAHKNKIKISLDISDKITRSLEKLSKEDIKNLSILIGIYMDNAIEAASNSRKKIVSLEIYKLKKEVYLVFSNTFNKKQIFKNINLKGVSSKGAGRGKGLYFANKIINNNVNLLKQEQQITENFYIQKLIITK